MLICWAILLLLLLPLGQPTVVTVSMAQQREDEMAELEGEEGEGETGG